MLTAQPPTPLAQAATSVHRDNAEPPAKGPSRAVNWLVAAAWPLPVITAVMVLSTGATSSQLWRDEVATWSAATRSIPDLLKLGANTDAVLTPYYALMHFWTAIFGDSELALRAPSMLAMVGVVWITALLGRTLTGPVSGMLAGLLLAFIPAISRFGHEARPYALASFAVVLATYLLVRALAHPTWARWSIYGAAVCVIGFVHAIALLALAAHGLAALFWATAGRARWRWLAAVTVGLLPLAPLLWVGKSQYSIQLSTADAPSPGLLLLFPAELFHSGPAAGAVILAGLCGAAAMWTSPDRQLKPVVVLFLTWGAAPCLLLWLVSQIIPMWFTRYVLFSLPAWALLAATALVRFSVQRVSLIAAVSVAGLAALSLGDQIAVRRHLGHENHRYPSTIPHWAPPNPDLRATAAYLRAEQKPGDVMVYRNLTYPWPTLGLKYELREGPRPQDILLARSADATADFMGGRCEGTDIPRCLGHPDRVWVIDVTRDNAADPLATPMLPELTKAISDGYRATTTWQGHHVIVTLFVARS